MKVTYIICNHNYGKYIAEAIQSAKNQTYNDIHICVIDDGSTDDSWRIIMDELFLHQEVKEDTLSNGLIKVYTKNYTAIKLPKSCGPSTARNIGIKLTLDFTDVYAILDADDINYNTKIEKCVNILKSDDNIGMVYADYIIYDVNLETTTHEYKEPYDKHRLSQECIIHSGSLIRKSALVDTEENTGYYDMNLRCVEDWDLWLRISEKYLAYHIAEPLSFVRVHQNNSTNSVHKDIWNQCWHYVAQKTKARNTK